MSDLRTQLTQALAAAHAYVVLDCPESGCQNCLPEAQEVAEDMVDALLPLVVAAQTEARAEVARMVRPLLFAHSPCGVGYCKCASVYALIRSTEEQAK